MISRMRKLTFFLAILLAAVLAVSSGFAAETGAEVHPGEEVTVPVIVKSNPDQAVAAVLKVEYDHETLDLIPSDFARNDTILLLDMNGIQAGEAGKVSFRVNANAEQGEQTVRFFVTSARDLDEKAVSGPDVKAASLSIAKAKDKPGDEYFSNGKIKKKVEFDAAGNVQRVLSYNRYGIVKRITESEAWDRDGNILRETYYFPNDSAGEKNITSYTYDERGNVLTSETVRKSDGTLVDKNDYTYDESDRLQKAVLYNEAGEIENYTVDYVYDANDNIISSRLLKPDGQTDSYIQNVWKNGVKVESYTTDPNGKIISRNTYDPVYGDILSNAGSYDNGERYTSQYTYYEDNYETDWRNYGSGYRHVTLYSADGNRIKVTIYKAKKNTDEWKEDSYTLYSTNEAGHTISEEHSANGSVRVAEQDGTGNLITSVMYKSDGSFDYAYTYEYDSMGQQIRGNRLYEDGSLESYSLYEYDSSGKKSKNMTYKGNGSFWYGYSYEYDGEGQTVRENSLNADGTVESCKLFQYNEKGKKIQVAEYDGDGKLKSYEQTEYDQDGKEIRTTKYDADGVYAGSYEYEYDEYGDRTHYVSYGKDKMKSYEYYYRTLEDGTRQSRSVWYNADGTVREEKDWE